MRRVSLCYTPGADASSLVSRVSGFAPGTLPAAACLHKSRQLKINLRARGFSIPDDAHHEGLGKEQIEGGSTDAEFVAIVNEIRQFVREGRSSTITSSRAPKICQTGFNYGTSAVAFLCGLPAAELISWDLGRHTYVQTAAEEVDKLFPGSRHTLVLGDSQKTLPNEVRCFEKC